MLLETRDAIHTRLRRIVGRNMQENLSNWQYPFYNLGGAGTHFDSNGMSSQPIGNQGSMDVLKPLSTNGFAAGPFTSDIAEVQDNALDKNMRIMDVMGFRGDFYDADEAEIYLQQRGVVIPPGANHVTVEVDPAGLGVNSITDTTLYDSKPASTDFGHSHPININNYNHNANAFFTPSTTSTSSAPSLSASPGTDSNMSTAPSQSPSAPSTASWASNLVDPLLSSVFTTAPNTDSYLATTTTAGSDFGVSSDGGNSNSLLAFAGIAVGDSGGGNNGFLPPGQQQHQHSLSTTESPRRELVTVDVNKLIQKMTENATCLGRTPGFRQENINAAFWMAARVIHS